METTVTQTTVTVGGKIYPLTTTKQVGLQTIMVAGEPVSVENVTILESPLGTSRCYTRARPKPTPEAQAALYSRIREVATQAMIDQGIW